MKSDLELGRREVVGGLVGTAALAGSSVSAAAAGQPVRKYAIVGCGSRGRMYSDAIWNAHKATSELVALCDTNPGRLAYYSRRATDAQAKAPRTYLASDFDKMIREQRPDALIVTTPDSSHSDYLVRALDAGIDVITEKPMTTDAAKVQAILDATKRNQRHARVTFNYRYAPYRTQIKEMLMAGEIGDILSVDFTWLLNTVHGADYFRRWHSNKATSGGLMVHKATHHFDLINWWLSDVPKSVQAVGKRDFYTPEMARRMGLQGPHRRCLTCPEKDKCTFHLDLTKEPSMRALYLEAEKYDGYFRDQCVWRPEIDIEDTMNVIVGYAGGATLTYSLNAFNAWEGYNLAFNGTKGRIEHSLVESAFVAGSEAQMREGSREKIATRIIPLRGAPREIEPRTGQGGHGGGDEVMLRDIFDPNAPADPLMRSADERGGAWSTLIGIAANRCFETGQPTRIASLVQGLELPAATPMPTHDQPLPMPPQVVQL